MWSWALIQSVCNMKGIILNWAAIENTWMGIDIEWSLMHNTIEILSK